MKTTSLVALAAVALATMTGCRVQTRAEVARNSYCKYNPESVALYLDGKPDRPYRVIGVVDAPFSIGEASKLTKMQLKACRLGADAVIAQERETPGIDRERIVHTRWGTTVVEHRVEDGGTVLRRGLAIVFVDAPTISSPNAPPAPVVMTEPVPAPVEPQVDDDEPDAPAPVARQVQTTGNIQIQAPSVEIHAPSVEFRTAPTTTRPRPAQPAQPQAPVAPADVDDQ